MAYQSQGHLSLRCLPRTEKGPFCRYSWRKTGGTTGRRRGFTPRGAVFRLQPQAQNGEAKPAVGQNRMAQRTESENPRMAAKKKIQQRKGFRTNEF
ncbi:MAG: hypothetical protein AB7O70_14740, partial [Hyphomicrobiales bacterium]